MRDSRSDLREKPTTARFIKILGERNTRSGYLERLLQRNLQIECLRGGIPKPLKKLFPKSELARDLYFRATRGQNLGWKNAMAPTREVLGRARRNPGDVLFLCCLTKNPYSWLVSLYRPPYHAKRAYSSFEDFLAEPWETVDREHAPLRFANPIEMWNQKNASYLALDEYARVRRIRYEDLFEDPFLLLDRLCHEHGLAQAGSHFENIDSATKGHDRGKAFADYRDDHLKERWRGELDSSSVRFINQRLSEIVMSRWDYVSIDPNAFPATAN